MSLLLLMALLFGSLLLIKISLLPLKALQWLHLPLWVSLSAIALAVAWCLEEER